MKKFAVNAYGDWAHLSTALGVPLSASDAETLARRLFGSNALVTYHTWYPCTEWWEVTVGNDFVADIFPN